MKVHPAIAALRAVDGSQRSAAVRQGMAMEAVKQDWLARIEVARVNDELERYGAGADLRECDRLRTLVSDLAEARAFTGMLIDAMFWALRSAPLSEVPLRYKASRALSTVQLLTRKGAVLALSAYEPLEEIAFPKSAVFCDRDCAEIVISGSATGVVHQRGAGGLRSEPKRWAAGDTVQLEPMTSARQIVQVDQTLVLMQLSREASAPRPSEEVDLTHGQVLRRASGDKSASQATMALGVLGALGAQSALDVMEHTALRRAEDPDVRWEAVRQMLGLDAARGFALLEDLSRRADDALCTPAQKLMQTLLHTHPDLRSLAQEPV